MTEAIILAGGIGSRLKSSVTDVPKPMAVINEKPFLYYLLTYLGSQHISRIILSVGYKYQTVIDYFGNNFRSIPIIYVVEKEPLGTGGGIALALRECNSETILIMNGDSFFPVNLQELKKVHDEKKAEITLALKKIPESDRYGTTMLNSDSIIVSFSEKAEKKEALINGGIYLLDKSKFKQRQFAESFSFEKDYLEKVVDDRCVAGCIFNDYFIDIGTPESYEKAQNDFNIMHK